MICKWCGANVDITTGKCEACGKPLPPVSDCGGFYNVVPKAANQAQKETAGGGQSAPQGAQAEPQNGPSKASAKKARAPWLLITALALTAGIAVAALVLSLVLCAKTAKLESALKQDGADATPTEAATEVPTEDTAAPTEETAPTEAPTAPSEEDLELLQQDLVFHLEDRELTDTDEIENPEGAAIKEHEDEKAWTICTLDGFNKEEQDENDYLWKAYLYIAENPDSAKTDDVHFVFAFDLCERLKKYYDSPEYAWQYYSPGEDTWYPLPKANGENLARTREWLTTNIVDGKIDIQCTITLKNACGGSLTIEYMLHAVEIDAE